MIKLVSDLRQVGGFILVLRFPPPDRHDITEILLKMAFSTINLPPQVFLSETLYLQETHTLFVFHKTDIKFTNDMFWTQTKERIL